MIQKHRPFRCIRNLTIYMIAFIAPISCGSRKSDSLVQNDSSEESEKFLGAGFQYIDSTLIFSGLVDSSGDGARIWMNNKEKKGKRVLIDKLIRDLRERGFFGCESGQRVMIGAQFEKSRIQADYIDKTGKSVIWGIELSKAPDAVKSLFPPIIEIAAGLPEIAVDRTEIEFVPEVEATFSDVFDRWLSLCHSSAEMWKKEYRREMEISSQDAEDILVELYFDTDCDLADEFEAKLGKKSTVTAGDVEDLIRSHFKKD